MAERPRVVIVAFEHGAQILDVTGPLEVFSTSNNVVPGARYRCDVASLPGGIVRTSCGLGIETVTTSSLDGPIDTLVIAGGRIELVDIENEALLGEVRRLAAGARRVTSVCTGAYLLASAGLLDGRHATTHWGHCTTLAQAYPQITVEPDSIYVKDENVWTSAGVTAGIDLALALVADDLGQQAAAFVARNLVVYLRRSGGQTQFSAPLAAQAAEREPFRDLLAWMIDHLADDLSVAALARRMNLSERQFARVFKIEVGISPGDHVEALRLEAACRLLETTTETVDQVARACGYGNTETLHRAFRRRMNTTPGEHRHHFWSLDEPRESKAADVDQVSASV
jgi:transcriptional regulator GlxA family with amidase domain